MHLPPARNTDQVSICIRRGAYIRIGHDYWTNGLRFMRLLGICLHSCPYMQYGISSRIFCALCLFSSVLKAMWRFAAVRMAHWKPKPNISRRMRSWSETWHSKISSSRQSENVRRGFFVCIFSQRGYALFIVCNKMQALFRTFKCAKRVGRALFATKKKPGVCSLLSRLFTHLPCCTATKDLAIEFIPCRDSLLTTANWTVD